MSNQTARPEGDDIGERPASRTEMQPSSGLRECPLQAVILDFDGVVLESVEIKTRAFRRLFAQYPEFVECIVRLHQENTGVSRYEKFKIIYRDYLKQPLSHEESVRLDQAFSGLVLDEVLSCPFVSGAEEFLRWCGPRWPLFVVSGTPQGELREIVRRRGLDHHFCRVYGAPQGKDVLLADILHENRWRPMESVFIGDGLADLRAAEGLGIPFVGRVAPGAPNPFPPSVRWIVSDLTDLMTRWTVIVNAFSITPA